VNYSGATAPLTADVSGVADDFELACMTTTTFTCPPPSNGAPYQITIAQGYQATFQLQIVPDDTFTGTVTLTCPTNLPSSPAGNIGSPTTCGLSPGSTVSLPLSNIITLPVMAGTAVPFNVTFQTTTTTGHQFGQPPSSPPPSSGVLLAAFSARNGGGTGGAGRSRMPAAALAAILLLAVMFASLALLWRQRRLPRWVPVFAIACSVVICATLGGCGHNNNSQDIIPYTPTGSYSLTVHGSAQNASRGYTMIMVVD
jgi:hypothetical protein